MHARFVSLSTPLIVVLSLAAACDEGAYPDEDVADVSAAATVSVYHSVWNGGSAWMSFWDGLSSGYLSVWEGGARAATAYLNFSRGSVDPTSEVCQTVVYDWCWDGQTEGCRQEYTYCYYTRFTYEYGWGEIPARDARLNGGDARLKTTIASGPSFWLIRCDFDANDWSYSCTNEGGGTIDLAWHKDGNYSSFHSGVSEDSYGRYTFRTNGQYRSSSALVDGSFLGGEIAFATGSTSSNRGVNVSKDVLETSPR